jgi:hypothetical protein
VTFSRKKFTSGLNRALFNTYSGGSDAITLNGKMRVIQNGRRRPTGHCEADENLLFFAHMLTGIKCQQA